MADVHVDDFLWHAFKLQGTPYIWAGKGEHGIDCSGLVTVALVSAGYPKTCPRCGKDMLGFHNAQRLFDESEPLPLTEARRGALAFFGHGTDVDHVGILVGGDLSLEASGGGRDVRTALEAARANAFVKVVRTYRRKNFIALRAFPFAYPE